jgi:hypothetical protein
MSDQFAEIQVKVRAFMCASLRGGTCEQSFEELALELFQAQRKNNLAYEKLCRLRGVGEVTDWRQIPAVPTVAFKELEMTSLAEGERERVFYSSGTTQRDRSRHFHSGVSLGIYEESLWLWFEANFQERMEGMKWLFLTPHGLRAPNSSLAHMFDVIASKQVEEDAEFFGDVDQDGSWILDLNRVVERLEEFERAGQPVALLGTAFQFVHLMDELERRGRRLELPAKSWILETGGYKGRSREVPKDELRGLLGDWLGVVSERIFGEYGMSELSSQAYDRGDGEFVFPPWARARIISPATGLDSGEGERGLIRVYDLANIWSVMAVQTEDFGMRNGPGFQLAGRAAQAEARGCSLLSA